MAFSLPDLPFAYDSLAPHMSAETLEFHHDKHHAKYVDTLNSLTKDTPLAEESLEEIMKATVGDASKAGIFNNAAQVWNHTFFWNCMSPKGGGAPGGDLARRIEADFGGFDAFKEKFTSTAVGQFGSGWAWLVVDGGKLAVTSTGNAHNPLTDGKTPLLTCDVWEHAYYLDYQNRRPAFVEAFLDKLVNWEFVASRLG